MIILSEGTDEADDPARSATLANVDAVGRVAEVLVDATTTAEAATSTLDVVRDAFGWAYGSYWRVCPTSERLEFQRECGEVGPQFEDFRKVTVASSRAYGEGPAGRAWATKDVVFVEVGRVLGSARGQAAHRAGISSGVVVPLIQKACVVGTLDFFSRSLIAPSPSRAEALRAIGRQLAQALERIETPHDAA